MVSGAELVSVVTPRDGATSPLVRLLVPRQPERPARNARRIVGGVDPRRRGHHALRREPDRVEVVEEGRHHGGGELALAAHIPERDRGARLPAVERGAALARGGQAVGPPEERARKRADPAQGPPSGLAPALWLNWRRAVPAVKGSSSVTCAFGSAVAVT